MAGWARFLLGVLALPLAAATVPVFGDVLALAAASERFFSAELFALAGGFVAFVVLWMLGSGIMIRAYVLGHELTHAVWALAFGAHVSNLKVSLRGGSVTLTKSNVLITLAPYFFPFYTVLVVGAALLTRIFVSPLPYPCLWLFAVGFTWCFHLGFTLKSLAQRQPDVTEYGRLFSWVFIFVLNFLGVVLWIWATTEVTAAAVWASVCGRVAADYLWVWTGMQKTLDFALSMWHN